MIKISSDLVGIEPNVADAMRGLELALNGKSDESIEDLLKPFVEYLNKYNNGIYK